MPAQEHPRATSTWTPVDGVRLHARLLRPPGRSQGPVAMVHGLGVSTASLTPLAERLAERRVVLMWDSPGFGLSRADRVWRTPEVAEAVAGGLGLRGFGRVVLVGHSWGCHVACELALRHPGMVEALVLMSPAFDHRPAGTIGQVLRATADAPMEKPSLLGGAVRDYLRAGPVRVLSTLREANSIPLEDLIARVEQPILILRGSRDPLTTNRWARDLRRRAGQARIARIAVIPRAAHGLGHDAPGPAAGAIHAFLDEIAHTRRMPGAPQG